ncbi:hypothetical protein BGZ70_009641 [Mortierella alpina]|uniref:Glycoside hydrolase 35 catalytic domain-containing protein n=1 Tax=Mortierella alpina TaxID=64518 RepID=A0A9P6JEX7_MORAP|nr:hypothetical protein BGZ70_009641 [Mortierella alpina]
MPPSPTLTLTVSLALGLVGLSLHRFLEHRTLGSLKHIHTQDTLYDKNKYGHILDFDKHSLILSGEFHYWRLPDRSRWRPILEQYRSAGLNCIRIYFHWGFHSPAEGKYIFDKGSNRDIEYLLTLCEELGLYVLAAPGPYICAETQAGGFPIWLAAKREIRLRHMRTNFWKVYDPTFMAYCVEYFEQILPFLARHQITNGNNGCVLALQIENEAFQHVFGYPFGSHDDMKVLAKTARDCGITVPLFTNDGFEQGSYIVKADPKRMNMDFGIDLYGFDNEPTSWVLSRDPSHLEEWSPSTVAAELDSMEHKVRSFGHANQRTPIFIPELQGGWFNHYGIKYTYDAIYKFYGPQYTRLLLDTVVAQGCTMLNFYMFYGGTNWGTLGDPDVYTSYDYSACIREYGLMSGRLRKLRQGLLFLQSFADIMVRTDAVHSSQAVLIVRSSLENTICQQRQSHVRNTNRGPVQLIFLRNFSEQKLDRFKLSAVLNSQETRSGKGDANATKLSCYLPYKSSFIALGNYSTLNPDIHLILSATPIVLRAFSRDGSKEIWIAALAGTSSATEMAFRGDLCIQHAGVQTASLAGEIKLRQGLENKQINVLSVPEGATSAHVVLSSAPGKFSSSRPLLHIIFLDQSALSTLYCHYDNSHVKRAPGPLDAQNMASSPKVITWGSYNARYVPQDQELIVESTERQQKLHMLSFDHPDTSLDSPSPRSLMFGPDLPYRLIALKETPEAALALQPTFLWIKRYQNGLELRGWEKRHTDFSLDYHFTSGHILYRGTFKTRPNSLFLPAEDASPVWLKVNMRHRVIAYVNGVCLGSHMTYSRQLLSPGAKMGWDPAFLGSHKFLIMPHALEAATSSQEGGPETKSAARIDQEPVEHEIILVIDSFGLSRQPFVVDDIRNPRGLLSARVQGKTVVSGSESWQVTGVDVRELDMAYESTGFPDEHSEQGWQAVATADDHFELPRVVPDEGVTWWRMRFEGAPTIMANIPLCCRLEGDFSAMILLNGVLVGRYFGADSPQQDFYLMDGLLHAAEAGELNELKLMIYSSNESESLHEKTSVRILPWRIEDAQGELGQWSGNALFAADEIRSKETQAGAFWTFRQAVPHGREA